MTICLTSCATKTVIIDSHKDVVRLGRGVVGEGFIWDNLTHQWTKVSKIQYPEGWYAGPWTGTNF